MTEPRIVKDGLVMGESPRWHDGRLWVADWGAREILAIDPDGASEVVVADVPALPFCFDWLPDGRLLVVDGREGASCAASPTGRSSTHADLTARRGAAVERHRRRRRAATPTSARPASSSRAASSRPA